MNTTFSHEAYLNHYKNLSIINEIDIGVYLLDCATGESSRRKPDFTLDEFISHIKDRNDHNLCYQLVQIVKNRDTFNYFLNNIKKNGWNISDFWDYDLFKTFWITNRIISPIIMGLCIFGIICNAFLLITSLWIKKSTPTLQTYLWMAGNDIIMSASLLTIHFLNFLEIFELYVSQCWTLLLDSLRMGSEYAEMIFQIVLVVMQCFGIKYPLRYKLVFTKRNVKIILALSWVIPTTYMLLYAIFFAPKGQGLLEFSTNCINDFTSSLSYSLHYAIFTTITPIIILLTYIFIITLLNVRKKKWNTKNSNISSSLQTVNTAAVILVSFLVFRYPGMLVHFLKSFGYDFNDDNDLYVPWWVTTLLHNVKPILNAFIYPARIREVKQASKDFCRAFGKVFRNGL